MLWIPIIVVLLIAFYGVGVYNKLVRKRTMVEEGWSGIDVQLKKRHNIIPNLLETVKGYAKHEQETLQQVISARNAAQGSKGPKAAKAEAQLGTAMANVFALGEAYPDLKANTNFVNLQNQLTSIEADIEKARRYYNATARENNIMVESFPSNLIAGMGDFELAEYFELEDEGDRALPEVKF